MAAFTLGAKGISPKGNSIFAIGVKSTKGVVKAQAAKYTVKLVKGFFAATLASYGLAEAATSKPVAALVTIPAVTVILNGVVIQKDVKLSYKATNKSGAEAMAK